MEVLTPVRMKRRRAPEPTEPAEHTEPAHAESPEAAPSRGLIRKSAVRRLLKQEYTLPLQIREAFFAALEAKLSEDLRRSVARAREQKRSTLMASDA